MLLAKVLVLLTGTKLASTAVIGNPLRLRNADPKNPYDEKTTSYCSWWHDYDQGVSCDTILSENQITIEQFLRWNPSVSASCQGLTIGRSYCVEAAFEPEVETGPKPSSTISSSVPTATKPSNGIETPGSIQPDMVDNCDKFYKVESGDNCESLSSKHSITVTQFTTWNPKAGSTCSGLWANAYACVSIIGHDAEPSPTTPSNGIETPRAIQSGMVSNCNKFHLVESGQGCSEIASKNGISVADIVKWNAAAGPNCNGLWAEMYACVGTLDSQSNPTTPTKGIFTPSPAQPSIVSNCYKFYLVKKGESCANIASTNKITLSDLTKWNPSIGSSCSGLWAEAHACVGVYTSEPSTQYFGCYTETWVKNTANERALGYADVYDPLGMTPEFCAIYCLTEKKQNVYGLQNSNECWCGNAFNAGVTKVSEQDCSSSCVGNKSVKCGGSSRLSVYGQSGAKAPATYKSYGCYTEGVGTRALGVANYQSSSMTIQSCADYCLAQKGTNHFNIQNGDHCFYGNVLGTGSVPAETQSDCNVKCAGNSAQTCGGKSDRFSLWSTSQSSPPLKYSSMGCYTELSSGRALGFATLKDTKSMTVEKCARYCISAGHRIFGLQTGDECWCGPQLNSGSSKASDSDCSFKCAGNANQKCGGAWRLNVYN